MVYLLYVGFLFNSNSFGIYLKNMVTMYNAYYIKKIMSLTFMAVVPGILRVSGSMRRVNTVTHENGWD